MWSSNSRREGRSADAVGLGQVLDELVGHRPLRAGLALGELAARWREVVGERLARECAPVSLDGGVLLVRAESQGWAAQIGFLRTEIRSGAEAIIGPDSVAAVRVVVGPIGGRREPR